VSAVGPGATGRTETLARAEPRTRHARLLWALVALQVLILSAAGAWKFRYFLYDDIDLAIFTQALSQLLHGSLWTSIRGMAWPGDHASWNLFLIAPLFALARHPLTLVVVQSAALALGAVAVHRLARREIAHDGAALALAAAWLLHPALAHMALFEFHPEALSTTALLFAFLELRRGRAVRCLAWSGLALLGKEDVALVVFAMGLYAATLTRPARWRLAGALAALAALALALNLLVLEPMFAGSGGAEYALMYREWGASPGEVARNVVTQPLRALSELLATPGDPFDTALKRGYWMELLLPLGFAPIASPLALLIALPIWLEHFLSWRYPQHAILNQYTALVLPFAAAAAVLGVARLARGRSARAAPVLAGVVLAAAVAGQVLYGPFRAQPRHWSQRVVPGPREVALREARERMLARVPAAGAVVASSEFLACLATRDGVHAANHLLSGAHTFSTRAYPVPEGVAAAIVDVGRERGFTLVNAGTAQRWRELTARNGLVPADASGDLMLFLAAPAETLALIVQDAAPDTAARVAFLEGVEFLAARIEPARIARGEPVRLSTWWRRFAAPSRFLMTQLVVVNEAGEVVDDRVRYLGYTLAPAQSWAPLVPMREDYRLVLPADLAPGAYTLGMRLWLQGSPPAPAASRDGALERSGGFIRLGKFAIDGAEP
jgi:uncharacterized membrane protein